MAERLAATFPDAPLGPVVVLTDGHTYRLTSGGTWEPLACLPGLGAVPIGGDKAEVPQPGPEDYEDKERAVERVRQKRQAHERRRTRG